MLIQVRLALQAEENIVCSGHGQCDVSPVGCVGSFSCAAQCMCEVGFTGHACEYELGDASARRDRQLAEGQGTPVDVSALQRTWDTLVNTAWPLVAEDFEHVDLFAEVLLMSTQLDLLTWPLNASDADAFRLVTFVSGSVVPQLRASGSSASDVAGWLMKLASLYPPMIREATRNAVDDNTAAVGIAILDEVIELLHEVQSWTTSTSNVEAQTSSFLESDGAGAREITTTGAQMRSSANATTSCARPGFGDCLSTGPFLPVGAASDDVYVTATAVSIRTDARAHGLRNQFEETLFHEAHPICDIMTPITVSRPPEWGVDLCLRHPTQLLSRSLDRRFVLESDADLSNICAMSAEPSLLCPENLTAVAAAPNVFLHTSVGLTTQVDPRKLEASCAVWDSDKRVWSSVGLRGLGFHFNGSSVALICKHFTFNVAAASPSQQGPAKTRSFTIAAVESPYTVQFSETPPQAPGTWFMNQEGRMSTSTQLAYWVGLWGIFTSSVIVLALLGSFLLLLYRDCFARLLVAVRPCILCPVDLLRWGPTNTAVCLRVAGRLPPLFRVARNSCCGCVRGDGLRGRGRGIVAALAHNFVNYGTFSRDPDDVAKEDIDEAIRQLGPRRVMPFKPPLVDAVCMLLWLFVAPEDSDRSTDSTNFLIAGLPAVEWVATGDRAYLQNFPN